MQAMRGVNHTWKREFEISVTSITINEKGPPPDASFSDRFPSLTILALGECPMEEAGLAALSGLKRLTILNLGTIQHPCRGQLAKAVTDAGLNHTLNLPLTNLNLALCRGLSSFGLASLGRMHMSLSSLNLDYCFVTDACLRMLQCLPLTELSLRNCGSEWNRGGVSENGLKALLGMPLTRLDLSELDCLTNTSLEHLVGLPLTDLDLTNCKSLRPGCLFLFKGWSLRRLVLWGLADAVTDFGLKCLQGMPLEILDLGRCRCGGVSGAGLIHLRGLPLVCLNLWEPEWKSDLGLFDMQHLQGMPLARLNIPTGNFSRDSLLDSIGNLLPADVVVTSKCIFLV